MLLYANAGMAARSWPWRLATALSAGLLLVGNAASSSRTGWVGLLLLVAMGAWWWRVWNPGQRMMLALALPVYVLAAICLPVLAGLPGSGWNAFERMSAVGEACTSRLVLWRNVLELIRLRPWTGWGWGELDYAHFVTLFPGMRFCALLDNAHNLPLHLAVELGIPVALLLCALGLGWIVRRKPWGPTTAQTRLGWMVLAVILLHSMLEFPLWYGPFQIAALVGMGLVWRPVRPAAPDGPPSGAAAPVQQASWPVWLRTKAAIGVMLGGTLLLGAVGALVAWDHWRVQQIFRTPAERAPAYRQNTLDKIRGTWFFKDLALFAELGLTPLSPQNARTQHAWALRLLHFSPEPLVIQRLLDSALCLGDKQAVAFFSQRYAAAYPKEFALWQAQAGCPVAAGQTVVPP